jgi:hypothetical protein
VEEFGLEDGPSGGTQLTYSGEMGTDLWALGSWWANKVAKRWEAVVQQSMDDVRLEAERRAPHKR